MFKSFHQKPVLSGKLVRTGILTRLSTNSIKEKQKYKNRNTVRLLIYIFCFICNIFKEIKVCIMLMFYTVRACDPYEGSCKFTIFAIFIREFCCIKNFSNRQIVFAIITPFKIRFSSINMQTKIDWYIINRDSCI